MSKLLGSINLTKPLPRVSNLIVKSELVNPFQNLSISTGLANWFGKSKVDNLLFVHGNQPHVSIGRNQFDYFRRLNLDKMSDDKVPMVRRFTGGPTYFVDKGVVSYRFMTKGSHCNAPFCAKRMVIFALAKIHPKNFSGRPEKISMSFDNFSEDIRADLEYPISRGHTTQFDSFSIHDGHIFIEMNYDNYQKYLREKMGIFNVRDFSTRFAGNTHLVSESMVNSFVSMFDEGKTELQVANESTIEKIPELKNLEEKSKEPSFVYEGLKFYPLGLMGKFSFGTFEVYLNLVNGTIQDCYISTDCTNNELVDHLRIKMVGIRPFTDTISYISFQLSNPRFQKEMDEIVKWIHQSLISKKL